MSVLLAAVLLGPSSAVAAPAFDWSAWVQVLNQRTGPVRIAGIDLTGVDYDGLRSDRAALDGLVDRLAGFDPKALQSRSQRLAFWINVYNVAAVRTVLDHPGIASIKDVGGLFSPVWKKDAIVVGGKTYSLDDIENGILRKMNEPRIHFAIVCASVSCPDLRGEPYDGTRLDAQLDDQVRRLLGNPGKGLRIEVGGKKVVRSKILDWFDGDFGGRDGVLAFVAGHLPAGIPVPDGFGEFDIDHFSYDWSLNRR